MFYRLPIFIIGFSITEKKNIQYDKYVSFVVYTEDVYMYEHHCSL